MPPLREVGRANDALEGVREKYRATSTSGNADQALHLGVREGSVPPLQKWPGQQMVVPGESIGPQGANFCLFYYAVGVPYYMMEPAHSHVQDMWRINLGRNPLDVEEFDAEITMWWGEEAEKLVMDGTSVAHVPPGLLHRGLFFDPVREPYVHIHTYTAPTQGKAVIVDEHVRSAGSAAAPEAPDAAPGAARS